MANALRTLCADAGLAVVPPDSNLVLCRCLWAVQAAALVDVGAAVLGGTVFGGPIHTVAQLQQAVCDQVVPPIPGARTPLSSFTTLLGYALALRCMGTPPRSAIVVALRASAIALQGAVLIDVAASPFLLAASQTGGREARVLYEARRQREYLLFCNTGFMLEARTICADTTGLIALPPGIPMPNARLDLAYASIKNLPVGLAVQVAGDAVKTIHGYNRKDVKRWLTRHGVAIDKRIRRGTAERPGTLYIVELPVPTAEPPGDGDEGGEVCRIELEAFIVLYQ